MTSFLLILSVVISFFLNLPTLFVQDSFLPGDAGSNLYCFQAVLQGQTPYHDFTWFYGPLMLYINALFFKLFGLNIHSVMLGRLILKTIFSGVFFLAARRIMPSSFSFLATIAFSIFMPEFPSTFNHYTGVCLEIGVLWAVLSYYQSPKKAYLAWGAFFVLLLGLCKINFGVLFLGGTFASFILCDLFKHKSLSLRTLLKYFISATLICITWGAIYFFLLRGLSVHEMKQCFPFFKGYAYYGGTFPFLCGIFFKRIFVNIASNPFDTLIAFVVILPLLRVLFHLTWNHSCIVKLERNYFLINALLLLFMMLSYHEYFKGCTDYQAYWAQPFTVMTIAYLISEACVVSGNLVHSMVFLACLWGVIFYGHERWHYFESFKNKDHFFNHEKINAYVTSYPRDMRTVLKTADYIEKNIPPNSLFFAFPADALYYFLSGKPSPYRLLYLLRVSNIPPEQEMDLIKNLEKKGVKYIVIDNVCYFGNMWGVFGKNYCPFFFKYLHKYFSEEASFDLHPQRFWSGTVIYKKKETAGQNIADILKDLQKK